MPSSRKPPDPVRDILEEAESELSRRLREACAVEARGVSTESAAEIRHLEDTLLAAAMAAARALAARKHLQGEDDAPARDATAGDESAAESNDESHPAAPAASDATGSPPSTAVREFEDESGRTWRAWPVTPGVGRTREGARRGLGDFQDGWICFEALDNSGRRRLPRREPRWSELPPDELKRLLAEALDAPGRTGGAARKGGESGSSGPH